MNISIIALILSVAALGVALAAISITRNKHIPTSHNIIMPRGYKQTNRKITINIYEEDEK